MDSVDTKEAGAPEDATKPAEPVTVAKKRRWGSSQAARGANKAPSVAISTEMLKVSVPA